jgi:hypothetical protein
MACGLQACTPTQVPQLPVACAEATPPPASTLICEAPGSNCWRVHNLASSGEPASGLTCTAPAIGGGAASIVCQGLSIKPGVSVRPWQSMTVDPPAARSEQRTLAR